MSLLSFLTTRSSVPISVSQGDGMALPELVVRMTNAELRKENDMAFDQPLNLAHTRG